MKSKTVYELLDVIKERTEENDHSGALVLASKLLDEVTKTGESKATKILKHVQEIHSLIGHMPSGLMEIREEMRGNVDSGLKNSLPFMEYSRYKRSM